MRINTNINSMRTQEYMRQNQDKMNTSMNRLSSGKSINSAADDAAGLAIATRMRAKEGGLNVGARNTQDAMSALRTTDSALNSISNILLRMRDLATQSANGTNDGKDKDSLNLEFKELQEEINHIAGKTNFNGKSLLAAAGTDKNISIQLSDVASDNLTITAVDATTGATGLGLTKTIGAPPAPVIPAPAPPAPPAPAADNDAAGAIVQLDAAIQKVADMRATFGSQLNRLDHNLNNVNSQATNMAASASQIEDADMAKEMSEMTKFKILNEAGISMLSQANQTPQMVSKLLQ
ncbi:TPA: flagellin [Bacillus cereus]|uniref:flagellin N-terminal helical domain-containing protein n=1 Tax=Bacillus cereus group TaxID=86661 RepID=UPI000A3011B4|nr:flagellin [Bacillus cereus]MED2682545.1 flagellin [Bacillus thuringiensis]EKS7864084.1 flagellin [Bacillus cereus]MBL3738366.1 flagellin [Bacillus cereus]MBL3861061.1 flagellin [Bacillus cereus]MEB9080689.1 flagellin [Bacillus cereus]